uniref:DNA damage-binding protein 1 n=1 Tax=Lingulaulax polyedra TaxID=160621 RepID=A0A516AGC8_LINPO|nr:DNA damage-binding protein 1 [Lingulodinium polyedra]
MSQWNYFVTAQRPTAVRHALGPLCFTSSAASDLVVAWATRLEVFRLQQQGGHLERVCEVPVNGRVAALQAVRPAQAARVLLLLFTEKRQLVVLRYVAGSADGSSPSHVATVAMGSLQDAGHQPVDQLPLCACDPHSPVAAAYLYEGRLQIVDLGALRAETSAGDAAPAVDLSSAGKIFVACVTEPRILDLAFLHAGAGDAAGANGGPRRPVLVALHADSQDSHFLSVLAVDSAARDLCPGARASSGGLRTKASATRLAAVPLPLGGVLAVGGSSASYHDSGGRCVASAAGGPREVTAVARADAAGNRWLLGGSDGGLWLLSLLAAGGGRAAASTTAADAGVAGAQPRLVLERLGLTSPPRALACLADGHVFVGSAVGDSQLLRLPAAPGPDGRRFTIEETWTNLGPVLDFCVADVDEQGQSQVVTCSGYGHTGSLRLVRIGIGINEVGSLEGFGGVLGMWALGSAVGANSAGALALGFVAGVRILALSADGTELAEHPASGLAQGEETLLCCEAQGFVLQVTRAGLRAVCLEVPLPVAQWAPPGGARVQVATSAPGGALLGLGSDELFLLQLQPAASPGGAAFSVAGRWCLGGEIACLHAKEDLCAAGLWTREVKVLPLQGAAEGHCEALPGDTIPRSVALVRLAGVLHLLVGMGDGRLVTFQADEATGALSQRKAVFLGSQPVQLQPFALRPEAGEHAFAASDRPIIVHAHPSAAGQLSYAVVNLRQVSHVAPFGAGPLADCLAFIVEHRLLIGSLEDIQRVHVRTVPLGESPHRVVFQQRAKVFVAACQPLSAEEAGPDAAPMSSAGGASGTTVGGASSSSSAAFPVPSPADVTMEAAAPRASLHFVHGRSLEVLQCIRLEPHEQVSSLCTVLFEGDPVEYVAVGTAFVYCDEPEPLCGRVLLFAQGGGGGPRFALAASLEVAGAVYALLAFNGMLLGSVNNRVVLWRQAQGSKRLHEVCCHCANILALHLQASGSHVLVGDVMRSASLLRYCAEGPSLEEVARDTGTAWLTAMEMLSEGLFLCADDSHNVFALARGAAAPAGAAGRWRPPGAPREDPCAKLQRVGQLHAGEFVNRMHRAALVQQPALAADGAEAGGGGPGGGGCGPVAQVVWASVDGAIGIIASLRGEREFARLSMIQDAVSKSVPPLVGLPHGEWRDCWAEPQSPSPHQGFVDGDLLESVLQLPRASQQAVVDRLTACGVHMNGIEGLLWEVEELAQLH